MGRRGKGKRKRGLERKMGVGCVGLDRQTTHLFKAISPRNQDIPDLGMAVEPSVLGCHDLSAFPT